MIQPCDCGFCLRCKYFGMHCFRCEARSKLVMATGFFVIWDHEIIAYCDSCLAILPELVSPVPLVVSFEMLDVLAIMLEL